MTLFASDYDKSTYMRGDNITRDSKFRIKVVGSEVLTDKKGRTEKKLILSFTNSDQQLVLNKTNLRTLKGAFGDDTANWINKVIVIFTVPTEFGPGLRIRIPPPKQPTAEAAPTPQPVPPAGNGAAAPVPAGAAVVEAAAAVAATAATAEALAAAADPELAPDPVKSIDDDLEDEIPF